MEKIIVYRNQWEKDADEFWHSEMGVWFIFSLVAIVITFVTAISLWDRFKKHKW